MSDNSHSTGSSGSSTNSWTLLSPEEGELENLGPVDDGTESLGDVPSLSEEVAGATGGVKPDEIQAETILSEEGQQVCQETSLEDGKGPIAASPTGSSPLPPHCTLLPDLDPDSQPPVIHDIVTSSPSDNNEHLGATPFVTNITSGEPLDIYDTEPPPGELEFELKPELESDPSPPVPDWPALEKPTDPEAVPWSSVMEEDPVAMEAPVATEAPLATDAPVAMDAPVPTKAAVVTEAPVVMEAPVITEDPVPVKDPVLLEDVPIAEPQVSISTETVKPSDLPSLAADEDRPSAQWSIEAPVESPVPESVGPTEFPVPEQAIEDEDEETELLENKCTLDEAEEALGSEEPSSSFDLARGDTSSEDEGVLRRRRVPTFEALRPRTSDEEEEDEEVEFRMAEKTEEQRGFSMSKCIVGALVLLCLGSLFLSDDSDSAELNVGEQTENWPGDDSQGMKEMLDKLAQENQKISQLEAKLQSQKEELDLALAAAAAAVTADEKGTGDLEQDNARMKDELSSLPGLKEELETLRARVTELSQLTAIQEMATTTETQPGGHSEKTSLKAAEARQRSDPEQEDRLQDQLQRQRVLLEESKNRLEGMKNEGGSGKGVREDLEKIQKRLSEHVEKLGRNKPWEPRRKESRGGVDGRDHRKKEDKTERRNENKDHKHGNDGGVRDKDREEEKEARKEGRERRQHKQNSHKEAWRKHQGEWERKKAERRMDREERREREPWPSSAAEGGPGSSGGGGPSGERRPPPSHQRQPRRYDHERFWRHQGEKLRRKVRPTLGCGDAESCAAKEALYPVELSGFEELLEGYLSKLEGSPPGSREAARKLTAEFFREGVFIHNRLLFGEFAEDVADVLEDMADLLGGEDDDALEEEMEEFEREALWKFSATA